MSEFKDGVISIRFEDKYDKPKKQLKKALEKAQRKVLIIQKLEDTVGLFKAKQTVKQATLILKFYDKVSEKLIIW